MKKKIGLIDLFIDEWHANNYPQWFRSSKRADEFDVAFAWEEAPNPQGKNLIEYCRAHDITPLSSLEEIVDKSDALCVLAPSNPEVHERLSELALASGKPVYIDKTFAPDRKTAERLFARAQKYGTPLMSSSALRFSDELKKFSAELSAVGKIISLSTTGGGSSFQEYGVHQLEIIVSVLGTGATRIMQCRNGAHQHMTIDYPDKRRASLYYHPTFAFTAMMTTESDSRVFPASTRMFENMIDSITDFFTTGKSEIDLAETIEIMTLRENGIKALEAPNEWIDLPSVT